MVSHFECVKCRKAKCAYTKPAPFQPACLVEITPKAVWEKLQEVMGEGTPTGVPVVGRGQR
jgi:hypothetical protein